MEKLLNRFPGGEFFKDQFNRDSRPRDNGLALHNFGVTFNP
jgi:hypothetical protein